MKKYLFLGCFYILFFAFTGCETEDDPIDEVENTAPVADAGPDLSGETGSTISLDGSGSTDADGDELTYLWEINTMPEGSKASLVNSSSNVASFIPDVGGTYTIALTVKDGEVSDTDEVLVTVEGEPMETVEVSSNINEDVVWENIFDDPAVPDYFVTRNIDVNAKLTIEPGVVVHMAEQAVVTVESGGGTLVAEGTADAPVTFTSFDEAGEVLWGGILVNSSSAQNSLGHVNLLYGGGSEFFYASGWRATTIGVDENGKIAMSNSSIRNSGGDGIFIAKGGGISTFTNNTFSENDGYPISLSVNALGSIDTSISLVDDESTSEKENVIRVYDSIIDSDQEWSALSNEASYLFQEDVSVQADLVINEGVQLLFDEGVIVTVAPEGMLNAVGTADNKVIFTSSNVEEGIHWGGLYFNSSNTNNELDHVELTYSGAVENFYASGWLATAVGVENGARLKLTNSEVAYSEGSGLVLENGGEINAFGSNNFYDIEDYPLLISASMVGMIDEATLISGNVQDVVAVYQSVFDSDASFQDPADPHWVALQGDAKYLFVGDLKVEDDLNIAPGAYLAFDDNVLLEVTSDGSLNSVGTADNKISFTSYEMDGNHHWGGIFIQSDNTNNQIEHAEIAYGGNREVYISGWLKTSVGVANNSSLDINNSHISDSKGYGIVTSASSTVNIGDKITYSNNALDDLLEK